MLIYIQGRGVGLEAYVLKNGCAESRGLEFGKKVKRIILINSL